MKKRSLSEKAIILMVIIVAFYVIIVLYSDLNAIIEQTNKIDFGYLPIISIFLIIHIGVLGIKFHRLLKKLNIHISFKESIRIFIAGISLVATPGGVGTAVKSHILKKKYGKPISSTLPIILLERLTELLAVLILLTFFLFWNISYESIIAIIIGYTIFFVILMITSNNKIFDRIKNFVTRIKRIKKLSLAIDESQESYRKLLNKNTFFEALGWSILGKSAQFLSVYFIFLSIGINFDWLQIGEIYHTPLILGLITFIPSGIIVTESSMIAILVKNNIELSIATLTVIFIRIVTIWIPIIVGLIVLKQTKLTTSEIDESL